MSSRSRSYFGLTLALALVGACGAETPTAQDLDPSEGDDETDVSGEADEEAPSDEEEEPEPAPPKDAGSPRIDAGRDSGTTRDAGSPADAGKPAADAARADAGSVADSGTDSGPSAPMGTGECCDDGDCLCHGDAPTELTAGKGPFKTAELRLPLGTVYYPTDAEPPFASVALCGGFTNTGPEMTDWGPMYASHGIVTIITTTTGLDDPATRGTKLLAAIALLKKENTGTGPLAGKLADRYGTSGYSMGGGGTTMATVTDPTLKSSIGLAPWAPTGTNVKVPTLLLCGTSDGTAPCSMAQGAYGGIADPTPKMMISISGATHFNWFGPTGAGMGTSGKYALAFQKVYLEGDERWKTLLLSKPSNGTVTTNIK